ncbi:hypothetical protein AB0937_06725 [Streptomyces sp. NPDC047880]|uniref:hypothetical protein n=1 Tax=Streptomyces sp. NPDC047880 TaxID=3155626 RepID=UPI0034557643
MTTPRSGPRPSPWSARSCRIHELVEVIVEYGVVTMEGRPDKVPVPELLASVREIDDVVDVVDDTEAV